MVTIIVPILQMSKLRKGSSDFLTVTQPFKWQSQDLIGSCGSKFVYLKPFYSTASVITASTS